MNDRRGEPLGQASQSMGIGSIGSVSFWQQDQNFWQQAQNQAQSAALSDALISAMGSVMANKAKGLARIATQTAQHRVQAQLTAALQSALQASQAAQGAPSSNASTTGSPAIGTGTVPLSATTALLTLGIPENGTITVSDGTNMTTYASTGTDTVGDLINAINTSGPKNAQVTASLNAGGKLVLTGNNKTVSVSVGGLFASNVGFGAKNSSFQPVAPSSSSSSSSNVSSSATSNASTASSASGSSTSASTNLPAAAPFNSATALQTGGTAETLLATTGQIGGLLNRFA